MQAANEADTAAIGAAQVQTATVAPLEETAAVATPTPMQTAVPAPQAVVQAEATSSGATQSPARLTRSQQHAPASPHRKRPLLVPAKAATAVRATIGGGVQSMGPLRDAATERQAQQKEKNEKAVLAMAASINKLCKQSLDQESLDLLQQVLFVDRDAKFPPLSNALLSNTTLR